QHEFWVLARLVCASAATPPQVALGGARLAASPSRFKYFSIHCLLLGGQCFVVARGGSVVQDRPCAAHASCSPWHGSAQSPSPASGPAGAVRAATAIPTRPTSPSAGATRTTSRGRSPSRAKATPPRSSGATVSS